MNRQLENRLKSLLWRAAMMSVVAVIDVVLQELTMFNMPDAVTLILGLVLGEISKFLNNTYRK